VTGEDRAGPLPRFGVATISARARLPMARVIAASLQRWNPGVPCFVLLADEPGEGAIAADEPFELLLARDLGVPGFERLAFRSEREELSYALTPYLLRHLLAREELDAVVFLKQESLVVGDLAPVAAPLASSSVVLTPHLLTPLDGPDAVDRELLVSCAGIFNGGVLGVAAREPGPAFLDWWAERIGGRCVHDLAAGIHYEQRWLDHVPALFDDVHVLRDPVANVGHWNMRERRVEVEGDQVLVDGRRGSVVRFSGYEPEHPERVTKYHEHPSPAEIGGAAEVLERYRAALLAAGHAAALTEPYAYDRFADGVAIPALARDLYRDLDDDEAAAFGDPFASGPGTFRAWLEEPMSSGEGPVITRLWDIIWRRRVDVQAVMPDHLGADREAFAVWHTTGRREHGVPDEL